MRFSCFYRLSFRPLLFYLLLTSSAALAGENNGALSSAEQKAAAQQLFSRGRQLVTAQDFSGALASFRQAAQAYATPGILYHVAWCHEELHQTLQAHQVYLEVELLLASQPAADVAQLLPEALNRVESLLSVVDFVELPQEFNIEVDGEKKTLPEEGRLFLLPGVHHFLLTSPGREDVEVELELAPGRSEPLRFGALVPPRQKKVTAPQESRLSYWRVGSFYGGLALSVGGAGMMTAGLVMTGKAQAELKRSGRDDLDSSTCFDASTTDASFCNYLDEQSSKQSRGKVLAIAGGASMAAGMTLAALAYWIFPGQQVFRVVPAIDAQARGVRIFGRF
ncbi:MAG: hypothetical protein MK135_16295 [Polyangiaceae bacterium]|nr:hypothetical protein [Polyangiaceae bacterium]